MRIKDRRTPHGDRRLLVPRQMRDRGLVETGASVDVDSVDHVVGSFHPFDRRVESFVLPGRGEE